MQNNDNQKTYFIYVRSTGEKVPVTKEQHDSFYKEADRTAASARIPKNRKQATKRRSRTTRSTSRRIPTGSWQAYLRTMASLVPTPKSVTSSTA